MYALLIQQQQQHSAHSNNAPSYEYHSHLSRADAERLVNDAEQRGDVVVGAVEMPAAATATATAMAAAKLPHPDYAEYVAQMDQATARVRQAQVIGGAPPMKKAATFAVSSKKASAAASAAAATAALAQRPTKSMSQVDTVIPQPLSAITTATTTTTGTGGKRVIQDDDDDDDVDNAKETPAATVAAPSKPAPATLADAPKRAKTSSASGSTSTSTSTSKKSSAKGASTGKQASVLSFFKKK
jgi:hypothetical protein